MAFRCFAHLRIRRSESGLSAPGHNVNVGDPWPLVSDKCREERSKYKKKDSAVHIGVGRITNLLEVVLYWITGGRQLCTTTLCLQHSLASLWNPPIIDARQMNCLNLIVFFLSSHSIINPAARTRNNQSKPLSQSHRIHWYLTQPRIVSAWRHH